MSALIAPQASLSLDEFMTHYLQINELEGAVRDGDCILILGQLLKAVPCDCGEDCPGWAMLPPTNAPKVEP